MSPQLINFLTGLGLLALFFWYFAANTALKKRLIGTFLAASLTVFSVLAVFPIQEKIPLGIDIAGGASFTMRLDPGEGKELASDSQDQAIGVLQRRFNDLGTKDISITKQGKDRIIVQIPISKGQTARERQAEIDGIKTQLKKVAKLDFHLVHPESDALLAQIAAGEIQAPPPGWSIMALDPEYNEKKPDDEIDPADVRYIVTSYPDMKGIYVTDSFPVSELQWSIMLNFSSEGRQKFGKLTETNVGRLLATVLDGKVISAPHINEPIYGNCQISGDFSANEARALAAALRNPLETPMVFELERTIDATLGEDSIQQGVYAGLGGLLLTLFFVLVYYRLAGLVTIIGLGVNIMLLFGALALFQFNLTLPGIAGIILTIGISIDANVLIFERLKEERRAGKPFLAAIQSAYEKAFSAILDANVTTLITALILLWKATGSVKGFSITLSLGILTSLFAALLVTRVCFGWATSAGLLKNVSMLSPFQNKHFDILGRRRIAAVLSILLIFTGIGTMGVKQKDSLGVDFRGGDLLTIRTTDESITKEKMLAALSELNFAENPYIQIQKPLASGGTDKNVRIITVRTVQIEAQEGEAQNIIKIDSKDTIQKELLKNIPELSTASFNTDKVGPMMGREMLIGSATALLFGLVGILLYLTMRFEFSFALGAIVALVHDLIITTGIIILFGQELSLIHVGALLTIAGYSINDTIVVFDRLRENLRTKRGEVKDVMNTALNTTLSRTLLTSLTTFITVFTLYLFGGTALKDFAFTIMIGVLIGTYSSVFVASPFVYWWARKFNINLRHEVLDSEEGEINT